MAVQYWAGGRKTMRLLTKTLAKQIPKLYNTENVPLLDKVAYAKLFMPWSGWHWYVMEYDGIDTCFGLVVGNETEFGYFSLAELNELESEYGLPVERAINFRPTIVQDLEAYKQYGVAA
jgi:hypothetical protein